MKMDMDGWTLLPTVQFQALCWVLGKISVIFVYVEGVSEPGLRISCHPGLQS
jgi:hypothetical protein